MNWDLVTLGIMMIIPGSFLIAVVCGAVSTWVEARKG